MVDAPILKDSVMANQTSQIFESYVPVYDVVPEKWEDAREFLIEHLKKISNAVNIREIGWFLDEELLSGKQFIPGVNNNQAFRTILRKVITTTGIVSGLNTFAHGVTVDENFTLIDLWAAASNSSNFIGTPINGTGNIAASRAGLDINYDATNIYVLSNGTYDRCNIMFEYIQEV